MFPSLDFIRATRRFFLAFSISTVVCLISKRCSSTSSTLLIDFPHTPCTTFLPFVFCVVSFD